MNPQCGQIFLKWHILHPPFSSPPQPASDLPSHRESIDGRVSSRASVTEMDTIQSGVVMVSGGGATAAAAVGMGTTDKKSPKLLPLNFAQGENVDREPGKIEGYLLKKRKRPMKGWHKVSIHQTLYSEVSKKGEHVNWKPGKIEGYLLKKCKRPMKGWHKVSSHLTLYSEVSEKGENVDWEPGKIEPLFFIVSRKPIDILCDHVIYPHFQN